MKKTIIVRIGTRVSRNQNVAKDTNECVGHMMYKLKTLRIKERAHELFCNGFHKK